MTQEEIRREKVKNLLDLLEQADNLDFVSEKAKFLFDSGVELLEEAEWVKDETYTGMRKDIYVCSRCNHWQSVNKNKPDSIRYKHYCDFCGRRMKVRE